MAEVVDSIIAELIVKNEAYVRGFNEATAAHDRFLSSTTRLKTNTFDLQAEGQKYKAGADAIAGAEDGLTQKVTRSRKARVDAVKQSGDAEVAAEIATQQRLSKAVADGIAARSSSMQRGSGTRNGATVPGRADNALQGLNTSVPGAVEDVAAEKEINSALVEQTRLQAGLVSARGEDRVLIREQIADMRTYNQLIKAGLDEEAAAVELDRIRAARATEQAAQQAATAKSAFGKDALRFGEGAGLGRSFGSTATVAGIAAAAGVAAGAEAVSSATDYAKALTDVSKAAGISTDALQVYQHAAVQAGAQSTDFDRAVSELSNNLGRARTGSEQQAKAFAALGINIKNAASAGDLMPTLIDRLSSISDQSKRAAVETALFGESGRKLDGLLSGGNAQVNALAAGLERTGAILSSSDIAKLDDVSKKLESVKAQLSVDLAQIVAGNANAILGLASSFETLVSKINGAIGALQNFNQSQGHSGLINTDFLAKPDPAKAQSFGDYLYGEISKGSGAVTGFLRGRIAGKLPAGQSNSLSALSASAGNFNVQPGAVNNSLLDKLNAPKGPKGKSADTLANEADERTKRFNDTLAKYQDEQLKALQQQTSDESARYQAQRDEIQKDSDKQIADLRTQAQIDTRKAPADAKLIAARLQQAISAEQGAAFEKQNVVNLQENLSAIRRDTEARTAALDFSNQLLQDGQRSTDTSEQRQKVALEILANEEKIKELTAQEVLRRAAQGDPSITQSDIQQATTTIANIPAETAARAGQIKDQTRSPGQVYADSLKSTSDTIQDSEVNALKSFNSELDKSVSSALHLHGIFGSIVDDLIDMAIKQALIKPLSNSLFGGGGGSGGGLGGLLGGIGKLFGGGGSGIGASIGGAAPSSISGFSVDSSLLGLPGLAGGGSIGILGNGGTDRNLLSLNGQPVAMVNKGESISVIPKNLRAASGGGGGAVVQHFDLRGAVMTQDILAHINAKSDEAAQRGAVGGLHLSQDAQGRAARRRLGGR